MQWTALLICVWATSIDELVSSIYLTIDYLFKNRLRCGQQYRGKNEREEEKEKCGRRARERRERGREKKNRGGK